MLKRILAGLVLVWVAVSGLGDSTCKSWAGSDKPDSGLSDVSPTEEQPPFRSEEGGFTITLPSGFPPPTRDEVQNPAEEGYLRSVNFYTENTDQSACFFSYALPLSNLTADHSALLDRMVTGGLKNVQGKLNNQQSFTVSGFPARHIYYTAKDQYNDPYYARLSIILTPNRHYFVGYYTYYPDDLHSPRVEQFFRSFRLIEKPTGESAP